MDMRSSKSDKRKIAEELHSLYCEAIRAAFPKRIADKPPIKVECKGCGLWFLASSGAYKKCESCRKVKLAMVNSFDKLTKEDRKSFIAAASACMEEEADTKDFVVAQFAMWREASAFHKKLLTPMPRHMGGLAARVRYLQHKKREVIRISRIGKNDDEDESRRWYVEERKLKGFARMQRRDPIEVLTEQPEQFSREFLKHKGVWAVVQDLWEERQHS